ncbi:FbpB family small basic protein [Fictibacillus phosphorivorans]
MKKKSLKQLMIENKLSILNDKSQIDSIYKKIDERRTTQNKIKFKK